jgi:hypothetical protein
MSNDQERKIGIPVDEFVKKGKQDNAKAQVTSTLRIFNEACQKARAEGVFVFLKVEKGEDGRPELGVTFDDPGEEGAES